MSQQWFECVCQFFRAQSENLSGILNTLGNQNTISDIGTNYSLQVPQGPSVLPPISPMTYFLILLAVIWGYMFLFSQKKKDTEKPTNNNTDSSGPDSGGSEPPAGGVH